MEKQERPLSAPPPPIVSHCVTLAVWLLRKPTEAASFALPMASSFASFSMWPSLYWGRASRGSWQKQVPWTSQALTWLFLLLLFFFHLWLHWVFVAARGLSLVAVRGGYSSLRCTGFTWRWLLSLQSTDSRARASVVVAHGLSCFAACGIFPDQGSNPCPLHC